ncbi:MULTISPECIES: hypothetical protein [unclassified Streptomyces]|uniref:hypothetical protein n=1 Tax=unclassified Streptomyces TaxID=2593676 RepID=UPI0019038A32|nr:hypothetical protein [Streptomyces sp. HSG2]
MTIESVIEECHAHRLTERDTGTVRTTGHVIGVAMAVTMVMAGAGGFLATVGAGVGVVHAVVGG